MLIITKYNQKQSYNGKQQYLIGLNSHLQPIYTSNRFAENIMHFKRHLDALAINDMAKGNIQQRKFYLVK